MQTPAADLPMVPREGAEGWTVRVSMPVWEKGKDVGRPVGWLTTNDSHASKAGGIFEARRRKRWREQAYRTYLQHRLPKNFNARVYMTFQYGFVDGNHPDVSNLPPTTKPIIDALQPYRTKIRKGKEVEEEGIGMIPDDNHHWVVIGGQLPLLPYLGRNSRIGGLVVVTITPL